METFKKEPFSFLHLPPLQIIKVYEERMKKVVSISLDLNVLGWIDSRKGSKSRTGFIEEILKGRMWDDEMLYQ